MKRNQPIVVFRYYGKIVSTKLLKKHGYTRTGITGQAYEDIVASLSIQGYDPKEYLIYRGYKNKNTQIYAIRIPSFKDMVTHARITRLKYPVLPPDEYNRFCDSLLAELLPISL